MSENVENNISKEVTKDKDPEQVKFQEAAADKARKEYLAKVGARTVSDLTPSQRVERGNIAYMAYEKAGKEWEVAKKKDQLAKKSYNERNDVRGSIVGSLKKPSM